MKPQKIELLDYRGLVEEVHILLSEVMAVGGMEGIKQFIRLVSNEKSVEKNLKILSRYVIKEYALNDLDQVKGIINSYRLLRIKGFPVPLIAKYYFDKEKIYLFMSDVSESGTYWVWGYSTGMTIEQSQEKKEMKLNKKDIKSVSRLIKTLQKKCIREKIELHRHYLHLRRHKKTNDLSIVLLDINASVISYENPRELRRNNQYAVDFFMKKLTQKYVT